MATEAQQGHWLKPDRSIYSSGFVRVAVLPVGDVSQGTLDAWLKRLNDGYRHVKLKDVQSFYQEDGKSPFKHMPWKHGSMHFSYEAINGRFEVCKLAELDFSFTHVAAIAVFACDAAGDINALYASYQAALSRLTDAAGTRLLACRLFGMGSEAAVTECRAAVRVNKKMEGLVAMEAWEVVGSMLSFCMLDFASCLLMNIADAILQLRYGEMSLETAIDANFSSGADGGGGDGTIETRRKMTRQMKRVGDLCLLAGSPQDAKRHYQTAINTSPAKQGEHIYVGSAHEGLAAAILLHIASQDISSNILERYDQSAQRRPSTADAAAAAVPAANGAAPPDATAAPDDSSELATQTSGAAAAATTASAALSNTFSAVAALRTDLNTEHLREASPADLERLLDASKQTSGGCVSSVDVVAKLRAIKVVAEVQSHLDAALVLYRERGAWPCTVLLKLKVARFQASVSVGSWRPGTVAFLMGTAQEARQLTIPRDRWVAQMDVAAVLGMIGAHRKRHFVLSELLHLLGKKGAPRDPDVVRAAFLATYDAQEDDGGEAPPRLSTMWRAAHMDLVKFMVSATSENKLYSEAWRSGSKLLREYGLMMRKEHHVDVFRLIQAAGEGLVKACPAAADGVCDVPEGPPPLVKCAKVHPLPAELRPVILRRGSGRPEAVTVFQYKADHPANKGGKPESAEEEEVIWVQDESASVQVYVLNPCAVAIPQQAEQQLILSLSSAHCNITEGGVPEATDKASAATSKPYQVQVPAKLNITHRGLEKYAANACTSLKLRPKLPGREDLLGVAMTLGPVRYLQKWSAVFPGEASQHVRLAAHSCKAQRREAQLEHNLRRCGIAPHGSERPLPISIPVAPAQPRLALSVNELGASRRDRSAANGGAAAASAAGGADRTELVLLEGQCAALSLTLENVGKLDIDHVTVDVASSSNVLAKYARDRHPLVHFTGVFASADTSAIALPLGASVLYSGAAGADTPSTATVPLHITAGSCPHKAAGSTSGGEAPVVTITVSYWSERAQPMHHAIKALRDRATQVIGRQVVRTIGVRVLPNLRVASVLAEHCAQRGGEAEAAQAELDLKLQIKHSASPLSVQACACPRAEVLAAIGNGGDAEAAAAMPARMHALVSGHASRALGDDVSTCSLRLPVAPFEAVHTFGKPAKPPRVGTRMPPVHDQLQLAANHFAGSAVVVWVAHAPAGLEGGATEPKNEPFPGLETQDAPQELPWFGDRSFVWGTLVLTKQMFMRYQELHRDGLRRMMRAAVTTTVSLASAGARAPTGSPNGDVPAMAGTEAAAGSQALEDRSPSGSAALRSEDAAGGAREAQVSALSPLELRGAIACTTHKHAIATLEWRVARLEDSDLPPDASARRVSDADAPAGLPHHALTPDALGRGRLHKLNTLSRTRQRVGALAGARRSVDPSLEPHAAAAAAAAAAHAGARHGVSDAFAGAGTLRLDVSVGTEAGAGECALQGMFLRAGRYEVALAVAALREAAGGAQLPVADYVITHPLVVVAAAGRAVE